MASPERIQRGNIKPKGKKWKLNETKKMAKEAINQ
jgi:hypothetical protein